MKSTARTKKFAAMLIAFAMLIATAFACGFGFTSKSASADTISAFALNADGNYEYTYYRSGEYKITDSGPLDQDPDVFNWNTIPLSLGEMYTKGYVYVTVSVQFDMKEKNKGYQQVFLYPTSGGSYNDFIQRIEIQYGGDYLVTSYGTVTVEFKSLPLSDFVTNNTLGLVVRYGATGGGEDTWYNKNCYVTVTLSKNEIKDDNTAKGNITYDYGYNNS